MFLEISQNSQENTCVRVSFLIKLQASGCKLIEKEILAQVFTCEFCEISKNIFFTEHLWATAPILRDNAVLLLSFQVESIQLRLSDILF